MSLTQYLNSCGFHDFEGNSSNVPQQTQDLIHLTKRPNIHVMEIGFNAGHSAETFLQNNPLLNLISFDLGDHDYITTSKSYIDATYPGRHTLILGDSRETVPRFIADNKDVRFDVIFIDGGHQYEIATADIENCFHLAHKDTIVMLDDTMFIDGWEKEWTMGPTRAWTEKTQNNKIRELVRRNYWIGRGMSWGKYLL